MGQKRDKDRGRRSGGQLLLEVLVALTILGVVAVAVVKVSTRSLKGARLAGNRKEALDLAKQVMVDVERERDDDIRLFFAGESGSENCGPLGDNDEYRCLVNYVFNSPPDSDSVEVEVLIEWEEDGGMTSVDLKKVFTKTKL